MKDTALKVVGWPNSLKPAGSCFIRGSVKRGVFSPVCVLPAAGIERLLLVGAPIRPLSLLDLLGIYIRVIYVNKP